MRIALTRAVPESIVRCELTHLERTPIDLRRAMRQHERYEESLRALGCTVERVTPAPDLADAVFVEDTVVVLDELAVVMRPGAASRRAETASVVTVVSRYRPVHPLEAPATMDGGDVLRLGRTLYVAVSSRTNPEAVRQLARTVEPFGYAVEAVDVRGCLHLKSAVTAIGDTVLLCNRDWIDIDHFRGTEIVAVHPDEPFGANVLRVGDALICAAAHERTASDLARRGYTVHCVDVSELARAEGGVTCCSVIVEVAADGPRRTEDR